MGDMFADNQVKRIIGKIIENKGSIKSDAEIWYQMTKLIIKEYGVVKVLDDIERIVEELADADWFENKYPPTIFKEKKERRRFKTDNKMRDLINSKLKIINVAKDYGLDTDKKGKTTCPFHFDTEPSLMLDDKKNIFHCFGCGAKGDVITFIKKMEEMKGDGNKKRS